MLKIFRVGALLFSAVAAGAAFGQTYPSGPIKLVVPFSPGGSVDLVARTIGKGLSEALGQPVMIENRPGASGNIGAEFVAKSHADGHTLFVTSSGVLAANVHLYKNTGFDPIKSFSPITRLVNQPHIVLVNNNVPAHSIQELIALAKARPSKVTSGTSGIGSGQDIATRQFALMTGIDVMNVPYKGGPPAMSDLLGGQIDTIFETSPTALPYTKNGKLRALATTSAKRLPLLPQLPTVAESGVPGYEAVTWIGIAAPAKTPKAIVDRLNTELNKALKGPMGGLFTEMTLDPIGGSPQDMTDAIVKDSAAYAKLLKAAGVEPQ